MTLLDAIRTLRKERDLPFTLALDEAIRHFVAKGIELPLWAQDRARKTGIIK
jgi:hypothetical protein